MQGLRVLLYQLRDDEAERDIERAAFVRATGLAEGQIIPVDVLAGDADRGETDGASAIIIGGCRHSVFDDVPGLDALRSVLGKARGRRIPVLGVCFGAQLVAAEGGGEVIRDQEHEEVGTLAVRTTDDAWTDLLFADMPDEFLVQQAHRDRVSALPRGAVLLASSDACEVQAFAIPSANVYAVQFHPERSKEDFEWLIDHRLPDHHRGTGTAAVRAALRSTPEAEGLVRKFVERMVVHRPA